MARQLSTEHQLPNATPPGHPHPAPLLPGRPRRLLLLLLAGPAATPSCPEGWRPGRAGRCGEEAPGPAPLPAAPGCHTPPQGLLRSSPSSLCPPRHSLRGGSEFLARKKEKRRHRSPHPAAGEATGRPARAPPLPAGRGRPLTMAKPESSAEVRLEAFSLARLR